MTKSVQVFKETVAKQIESAGVVTITTPSSFKWQGQITWPEPDEWTIAHWEFYRNAVFETVKARKMPPHDNVREDFLVCLRFTLEFGAADIDGLSIASIAEGSSPTPIRFMTWVYNRWAAYVRSILDPKG